ncbi:MAG: carboxypeptidase-like regulatory domain-containing protein [Planctomycetes bacterium]|nr:carboxypeptidase-like regulatory domain-containing protein [Planctomycetota bacterium]
MIRLFVVTAVCSFVCLASAGCGPKGPELGTVTGQVTMDGQPLANVLVTFVPEQGGRAATGTTDADGRYQLMYIDRLGALPGKHRVSVKTLPKTTAASTGKMSEEEYEKAAAGAMDPSAYDQAKVEEPIPARYNTETELVEEVKAGENVIDLKLTSDATPAS